jgi:hypothetical protein
MRNYYAWTPLVIVFGLAILLTNVYLALIALVVPLLAVVAALAAAVLAVPYVLGRYVGRRWREHAATRPHPALSTERQRAGAR